LNDIRRQIPIFDIAEGLTEEGCIWARVAHRQGKIPDLAQLQIPISYIEIFISAKERGFQG
jgi:hypothetical protein